MLRNKNFLIKLRASKTEGLPIHIFIVMHFLLSLHFHVIAWQLSSKGLYIIDGWSWQFHPLCPILESRNYVKQNIRSSRVAKALINKSSKQSFKYRHFFPSVNSTTVVVREIVNAIDLSVSSAIGLDATIVELIRTSTWSPWSTKRECSID